MPPRKKAVRKKSSTPRKKTTRKKSTRKTTRKKATRKKVGPKRKYRKKSQTSKGLAASAFFIALALIILTLSILHLRGAKSASKAKPKAVTVKAVEKPTQKKQSPKPKAVPQKKVVKKEVVQQPQAIVYDKVVTVRKQAVKLSNNPKMVFMIDDIGYHRDHEQLLDSLDDDVVYAILPLLPYSRHFSNLGAQNKADVILHLPLQTVDGTIPGRGLITDQMSEKQIRDMIARNLASVPHHIGSNNHMGSLGTSNPQVMAIVLDEMKRRNLFFIDSVTTSKSVVTPLAEQIGLRHMRRDIFLDNVDTVEAIRAQVLKQAEIARTQGYAVGIGHYRGTTLSVLKEMIPQLEAEGYEVLSLTELMKYLNI